MNALTPNEITAIQRSLASVIGELEGIGDNIDYPFLPHAITKQQGFLTDAKTAREKLNIPPGMGIRLEVFKMEEILKKGI